MNQKIHHVSCPVILNQPLINSYGIDHRSADTEQVKRNPVHSFHPDLMMVKQTSYLTLPHVFHGISLVYDSCSQPGRTLCIYFSSIVWIFQEMKEVRFWLCIDYRGGKCKIVIRTTSGLYEYLTITYGLWCKFANACDIFWGMSGKIIIVYTDDILI